MTTIDTIRPMNASRITDFFASAFGTLVAWNAARVTRKALDKLTDRELDDIGLCRGDIEGIAG